MSEWTLSNNPYIVAISREVYNVHNVQSRASEIAQYRSLVPLFHWRHDSTGQSQYGMSSSDWWRCNGNIEFVPRDMEPDYNMCLATLHHGRTTYGPIGIRAVHNHLVITFPRHWSLGLERHDTEFWRLHKYNLIVSFEEVIICGDGCYHNSKTCMRGLILMLCLYRRVCIVFSWYLGQG